MSTSKNTRWRGRVWPLLGQTIRPSLALFTTLAPCIVWAQPATTTVTGRVQDVATREYLNRARVQVEGTNISTLTNNYGEFRLSGVPSGNVNLVVSSTGFYPETVAVDSSSPERLNVSLRSMAATRAEEDEVFELEAYEVRGESDAIAAALNVQRYSDTARTVVDSGAFGNVTEGNIGEFVKFLPGISIDYVAADARTIEVRGLGANLTQVTVDGNQMASASSSSSNRQFELEQVSLNNVERIEVIKVPTAEMPANTIGGRVNLVSKSAFEREGREVKYSVYLSANSEEFTLKKTPGWGNEDHYKIWPGLDFHYSDVYMDGNLGLIFAYKNNNQFNIQQRSNIRWEYPEFRKGVADPIPVVRRYTVQDGPKFTNRQSGSVKGDYRVNDNTVLSASLQYNYYSSEFRNTNITWDTNIDERADITSGTLPTATSVTSKLGGGDIDYGGSWRDKYGDTVHTDFELKHFGDQFEYKVGGFYSHATNHYDSAASGYVESATLSYDVPGYITLSGYGDTNGHYDAKPQISVTDANGNELPNLGAGSLDNYFLDEVTAFRDFDSTDTFMGGKADGTYFLKVGDDRLALKSGLHWQRQNRDVFAPRTRLLYRNNTTAIGGQFLNEVYSPESPGYGLPAMAWPDFEKIYDFYLANRGDFIETRGSTDRSGANAQETANGDFEVEESITAAYAMAEYNTWQERLTLVAGVRYEYTDLKGDGLAYDPDRDTYDPYKSDNSYDNFYPSVAAKLDVTDNLVLRLAYAQTIGRPNFSEIIPSTDVDLEEETLDLTNPELEPQFADNFDLSLEYYTPFGGALTLGLFHKKIDQYIGTAPVDSTLENLERLGLSDAYEGFTISQKVNRGDAKIDGIELGAQLPLSGLADLPGWAQGFTVFANGTFLKTKGNFGSDREYDDLEGFIKRTYNFGVTYEMHPVTVRVKYNHRGKELLNRISEINDDGTGYNLFQYYDPFEHVDVDLEYAASRHATIFFSARNIFGDPQDRVNELEDYGLKMLERREEFGVQMTLGIKGTF
ncbi:MAG: TonB-dependent receptor [Verrucomicrobiota bacterium JB022]|nr:TonB-dependent receptor [Verrucomicrobiota bacterium JB022]